MNIQTNQILKVVFLLPDQLITRFSSGFETDATMVFDAFPENSYALTFQEVDTEADPKTGSYKVTMVMERPTDVGILPGMSGTVNLVSALAAATKIPTSAMVVDGDDVSVWRVNSDGIVESVSIVIDEKRHIVSGLDDGDRIVTSGVNGLESGIKVREWIKERGL